MKQIKLITLFVVLMSLVGIKASAFSPEYEYDIKLKNDDGVTIYYKWINNKTELAVYYEYYYDSETHSPYSGNIVIPETIEYNGKTYNVTSIGKEAFLNCSGLTSVTIPSSVTSIGSWAFRGCSGLSSITIPNSVTSINDCAFYGCSGLTSVTIPSSVTSIGNAAFANCGRLTSINIPRGVTFIGENPFYECFNLTSITVEDGNPYYDSRNNCNAIIDSNNQLIAGCKSTIIPNSVTSIGWLAFSGCTGLTSVNIPNNVTSIRNGAFLNCTALVYVTLPSSLISIEESAFFGCNSLTDIYINSKSVPYVDKNYTFSNPGNITLYVPWESYNAYKSTEPWNKFKEHFTFSSSTTQIIQKCSKPTISIVDGKFEIYCETSDVYFRWSISTPSSKGTLYQSNVGTIFSQPITFNVYATKDGYQNSEVTTFVFSGLVGDVDGDGLVNVADHVKLSEIIMNK